MSRILRYYKLFPFFFLSSSFSLFFFFSSIQRNVRNSSFVAVNSPRAICRLDSLHPRSLSFHARISRCWNRVPYFHRATPRPCARVRAEVNRPWIKYVLLKRVSPRRVCPFTHRYYTWPCTGGRLYVSFSTYNHRLLLSVVTLRKMLNVALLIDALVECRDNG